MKSSSKVWSTVVTQSRDIARDAFNAIETMSSDGAVHKLLRYPCLEAIVDAFKVVYEAIVEFQASHEPTLHKILPSLQYCKKELSQIESGHSVCRGNGIMIRPSMYSERLCGAMRSELDKIEVHGLWLVAYFLYPFLRDMEFWKDPIQRE